ncbi:MAG: rod shape-determining protein RodA [Spirochaetes bacterium]|nr:rod shape-determining protein RodA [Spirochaetota bacterium]
MIKNKYANEFFSNFDYIIFITSIILIVMGLFAVYSSTYNYKQLEDRFIKQFIFFLIGLASGIFLLFINYKKIADNSMLLYIALIFLLIITLVFGKRINGSKSWLSIFGLGIQFSELGKIIIILFLSKYISLYEKDIKYKSSINFFILLILFLSIPVLLILVQPDLGTIIIYYFIFIFLAFFSGLNYFLTISCLILPFFSFLIPLLRSFLTTTKSFTPLNNLIFSNNYFLFISFIIFLIAIIFLFLHFNLKNKAFLFVFFILISISISFVAGIFLDKFLKGYQKARLIVFVNPELDKLGAGYNIIQSKIAIGSGGLFGKGYLKGTQAQFGFLPEKSTDFIFSIIGEEFGFIGTFLLLLIYAIFLLRLAYLINSIKDYLGKLIITGIFSYFFTQSILNIGMTIGLMPITGVPLPFISYGGSSLLTSIYSVFIVLNINSRRYSID